MTARVQDHLAMQFTYSKPDDDKIIGICLNDGDWEYDNETIDVWTDQKEAADSSCSSGGSDRSRQEVVVDTYRVLYGGGRRKKIVSCGNGSGSIED